jgi:predicted phosphodiesterase
MNKTISLNPKLICLAIVFLFDLLSAPINASDNKILNNENEVRFIIFGDSQFGNPPQFERMIYEAEMLRPNFVIQVGDLIHGYTHDKKQLRNEWKRFKKQISPLSMPYYPVPGNHDVVTDEAEEVYAEVWGKEKLLYSFDEGSIHCIILNSWWGEEDDRIAPWQLEWLRKDLENFAYKNGGPGSDELNQKSIFVFFHSPLWKYNSNTEGKKDWDLVHELLKKYPAKLIAAGHTHEHVWEERDGIDYLVLNSAGVKRRSVHEGKFSSFLHVSVMPDGNVSYAVIKAGSILPLDSVSPIERNSVPKYNIGERTIQVRDWAEGRPLDIEIKVPIENELNEDRTYKLIWDIPYGAEIEISPFFSWVDVPANDTLIKTFKVTSQSAPAESLMPSLILQTEKVLRSGVVSRNWEAKYRSEKNSVFNDELRSSIILDELVSFEGEYDLFAPPVVIAKFKNGEIKIDGIFDEPDWKTAYAIDNLKYRNGDEPEIKTNIKILYDKDYLYIAAKMDEPNPENLHSTAVPPIPFTWNDDDIELFFDTEQTQKDYTRLFQNSAGIRFNSLQRWVADKYFQSKYTSKIVISGDAWFLEMQIPWSDIDLKEGPQSGEEWGINVGRNRQQSEQKEMIWSGNLYQPQRYGILRFE